MSRCAALAAAVALLAATSVTHAAKLPKWARPIAESAGAVPVDAATDQPILLLRERTVEVEDDGRFRTRLRAAVQLTSARNRLALDFFPFRDGTKIKTARAWHKPPGAKVQKSDSDDAIDVTLGTEFISNKHLLGIQVNDAVRGSLVFFEFEAVDLPSVLEVDDVLIAAASVRTWRLRLELPAGWRASHAWLHASGPEPARDGDALVWEMKDVPGYTAPPQLADEPAHVAPRLSIAIEPSTPTTALHAANWGAYSTWYDGVTRGGEKDPAVAAEAARVCAGVADPLACGLALARHVRDRVRYVAVELDTNGYTPRRPAVTLTTLWGDCKDKTTLLRALLASRGLESYPLLVDSSEGGSVDDRLPSLAAFDHVVLAVAIPANAAVPAWLEPARLDGGALGPLLVVDATAEHTALGAIPANICGHRALLCASTGGGLVTIPASRPENHTIEIRCEASRTADGATSWSAEYVAHGEYASTLRALFDQSVDDYRKNAEARLRETWIDAKLATCDVTREREDGAFVERRQWSVAAPKGNDTQLALFPGAADLLPRVPLAKRTASVVYGYPRVIRVTTRVTGVPSASALPSPKNVDLPCGSVRSSIVREDEAVIGRFETTLRRDRIEPSGFADLKAFWSAVVSASEMGLNF